MYSHSDIEEAVEGGALSADQAASLRNFIARRNGTPTADEEPVRWLLGFNDLYCAYSSIILLVGIGWLGSKIGGGRDAFFLVPLLVALGCWGLSEYFAKKKKLAMTAIALAMGLFGAVYFTIVLLAVEVIGSGMDRALGFIVSAVAGGLVAGAAILHWKRFSETVAFAGIAGGVGIAVMSLLGAVVPNDRDGTVSFLVLTLVGVATLAYAQTWEARDIHRTTRKGEIGFWLHYAAAFEVVIGLVGLLGLATNPGTGAAIGGIVIFLVLALVGIVLDRRIWVLLGAWPLGTGIFTLLQGGGGGSRYDPYSSYGGSPYGSEFDTYGTSSMGYSPYRSVGDTMESGMLTVLIVGLILVLIGIFWTKIRSSLGGLAGPLAGKVPPTRATDNAGQPFE